MTDGWEYLDRKIDDYDLEWESWTTFIRNCWIFYVLHLVLAELIRTIKILNPSPIYFFVGSIYIFFYFNLKFYIFLLLQTFTYFFAAKLYNKYCVWILGFFWLSIINLMKIESNTELASVIFNINVTKVYHLLIIMAWFMLRGVSFGLENINYLGTHLRDDNNFSLINFLGYSFYFPTILFGPNVIYSRYMDMLNLKTVDSFSDKIKRFFKLLLGIARYSFWYFFTAFCLHYFHIHVVQSNTKVSNLKSSFHLKGPIF